MNNIVPEDGLDITAEISDVEDGFYTSMFKKIDDRITKENPSFNTEAETYRQKRNIIANYLYLIYERLQIYKVRDIDYEQIKSWAKKHKDLATLLLSTIDGFPMEAFYRWIIPRVPLYKYSMYRRRNRLR